MSDRPAIRVSHRDIVFENADYIAVNKRRGWLVHRTLDPKRPDLFTALQSFLKHRNDGVPVYLALHHRLDVDTSGVIVFGKTKRANPVLAEVFRARTATKIYEALCVGVPLAPSGELIDFLDKQRVGKIDKMVRVHRGGKKAITRYRVLERRASVTKLELELVTGRMHQLRAQCSLAGFPILGDELYGDATANRKHARSGQVLHARRLTFEDPLSGERIEIEAPWPDDSLAATEPKQASPHRYLLFFKPFGVTCQFTKVKQDDRSLADFGLPQNVYAIGRLDKDSEGLLLLTNDGRAKDQLSHPRHGHEKVYWVQVEGVPSEDSLGTLRDGVIIKGYLTKPCKARHIDAPALPARVPPIRFRKHLPTSWLEIILSEGKNRQIRRMTASVGHPTLRLVRVRIGAWSLGSLQPGGHLEVDSF